MVMYFFVSPTALSVGYLPSLILRTSPLKWTKASFIVEEEQRFEAAP